MAWKEFKLSSVVGLFQAEKANLDKCRQSRVQQELGHCLSEAGSLRGSCQVDEIVGNELMIEATGAVELDIQDKGWSKSGPSLLQSEGLPSADSVLTTSLL